MIKFIIQSHSVETGRSGLIIDEVISTFDIRDFIKKGDIFGSNKYFPRRKVLDIQLINSKSSDILSTP